MLLPILNKYITPSFVSNFKVEVEYIVQEVAVWKFRIIHKKTPELESLFK